jgi:hypothetical protein
VEDHSQGFARRDAPLTVIFARRENARREEDGPVSSRGRGPRGGVAAGTACLRGGPADLVAAPSPEGSRPAGLGKPPAPESARCPPTLHGSRKVPAPARAPLTVVSRSRSRTRAGPDGLARPEGVPLLMIQAGYPPKMLQEIMGHASITMTLDLYGHLYPGDMDRYADRLDSAAGIPDPARIRPDDDEDKQAAE